MNTPYAGFDSDIESITDLIALAHEGEILTNEETEGLSALVEYAQHKAPYEGKALARNRFRQAWDAQTTEIDGETVEFTLEGFFENNICEDDPEAQTIDIPLSVAAEILDELANHPREDEFPEEFETRDEYLDSVRGDLMQCILAATNIVVIDATEEQAPVLQPETATGIEATA